MAATAVRVYDESNKRVNWYKLQSEVIAGNVICEIDKGLHYFQFGKKNCVCGKYDGTTSDEDAKKLPKAAQAQIIRRPEPAKIEEIKKVEEPKEESKKNEEFKNQIPIKQEIEKQNQESKKQEEVKSKEPQKSVLNELLNKK